MLKQLLQWSQGYQRYFRYWAGPMPGLILYHHDDVEVLLSSTDNITKSMFYDFGITWIKGGLLLSTGSKWKTHRRIITPSFHFKNLEEFVDIFNKNGRVLCDKLTQQCGRGTFNVYEFINLTALDNICECAMGIELNAQKNSESVYVRAIKDLCMVGAVRMYNMWMHPNVLFNMTRYSKIYRSALQVVTDTALSVIKKRRQEYELSKNRTDEVDVDEDIDRKKRMTFLDHMLRSVDGEKMSDTDIRVEVDTFMFAGHDTVTSAISFTLYELSRNPSVQEKCFQEQLDIFGDSDRPPTNRDLQAMRYLEMVLKETQRLYPSVPVLARRLDTDIQLPSGKIVPRHMEVSVFTMALHRNPEVWDNPDTFNPDHFLPEAVQHRHPFAFVPFSAGSRNCIGQRFAMMEMKAVVSKIVRRFTLSPCSGRDQVQLSSELVLISKNGVNLQIQTR